MQEKGRMLYASNLDEVKQILQEHELSFAAIDYFHGRSEETFYLNAGDVHSEGKKCWEVLQQYEPELPVFIWETDNYQYNREEVLSFLGKEPRTFYISHFRTGMPVKQRLTSFRCSCGSRRHWIPLHSGIRY